MNNNDNNNNNEININNQSDVNIELPIRKEVSENIETVNSVNNNVENNNDNNNNNKKNYNVIGVLLAFLIIGVSGFIIYKNFIEIGSNLEQKPTNNSNSSNKSPKKEEDINKIGFEKYNMLYSKNTYTDNTFIFFRDKDVDVNNISNQDKLFLLYSFLSSEDKNKTGSYSEDCFLNKGLYNKNNYPDSCSKETFDKEILAERLKTNFDNNMTVDYKDFFATSSNQCFINNSTYTCYLNASNYQIMPYTTFMKYEETKQVDDKLEIYNYLLTVRKFASSNYSKGVYSNSSATNKIDDLPFEIGDTITQELTDKLINQYRDKITKYKSTFIKVNNDYLWQKTEIIK